MPRTCFEIECKKTQLCWLNSLADILNVQEVDNGKYIVKVDSNIPKETVESELYRYDNEE